VVPSDLHQLYGAKEGQAITETSQMEDSSLEKAGLRITAVTV
jgi:hypothetical protein